MTADPLFEALIGACGISEVFAPLAIRSALARAGVEPDDLDEARLKRALPEIEGCIRLYLGKDAEAHIARVRALTS